MLLVAHPLHAHRRARHRLRDQCSISRRVVGAIVAVAARALDVIDDDVRLVHAETFRQVLAQAEDALAVGPELELVAFQRAMAQDGPMEACAI